MKTVTLERVGEDRWLVRTEDGIRLGEVFGGYGRYQAQTMRGEFVGDVRTRKVAAELLIIRAGHLPIRDSGVSIVGDVGGEEIQPVSRHWIDAAWDLDDGKSNPSIRDGGVVKLLRDTKGECGRGYFHIPAGAEGVVVKARTPRVSADGCFANVDVTIDGEKYRIRVPHNAISTVGKRAAQ